ncbi:hypothetical protein SAY87_027654 [Trapa incisa]|uniref:Uncharacterized protein n=1 Tax=Trapa incisa TaxID=236973 RepID=A0AAN7JMZ3_9MYRT|nr:hypothetical protein SAY87_027654 [Trapa incisa]
MGRTHELSSTSELASHHTIGIRLEALGQRTPPDRPLREKKASSPHRTEPRTFHYHAWWACLASPWVNGESCNHSAAPSATTAAPSSSARSVHTALSHPEANQDVTTIRENHQVSSVSKHNRVHLQQKSGNSDLINQLPPKNVRSRISSQHDNRNLVISFSNDESSVALTMTRSQKAKAG